MKEVQIGPLAHQVMNISTSLTKDEECNIVDQLNKNLELFTWAPSDMPMIDTKVISHRLFIHPSAKPVAYGKRIVGEEKMFVIDKELGKSPM